MPEHIYHTRAITKNDAAKIYSLTGNNMLADSMRDEPGWVIVDEDQAPVAWVTARVDDKKLALSHLYINLGYEGVAGALPEMAAQIRAYAESMKCKEISCYVPYGLETLLEQNGFAEDANRQRFSHYIPMRYDMQRVQEKEYIVRPVDSLQFADTFLAIQALYKKSDPDYKMGEIIASIGKKDQYSFVATHRGDVVGYVRLERDGDALAMQNAMVDPAHADGQGIAKALMHEVERLKNRLGIDYTTFIGGEAATFLEHFPVADEPKLDEEHEYKIERMSRKSHYYYMPAVIELFNKHYADGARHITGELMNGVYGDNQFSYAVMEGDKAVGYLRLEKENGKLTICNAVVDRDHPDKHAIAQLMMDEFEYLAGKWELDYHEISDDAKPFMDLVRAIETTDKSQPPKGVHYIAETLVSPGSFSDGLDEKTMAIAALEEKAHPQAPWDLRKISKSIAYDDPYVFTVYAHENNIPTMVGFAIMQHKDGQLIVNNCGIDPERKDYEAIGHFMSNEIARITRDENLRPPYFEQRAVDFRRQFPIPDAETYVTPEERIALTPLAERMRQGMERMTPGMHWQIVHAEKKDGEIAFVEAAPPADDARDGYYLQPVLQKGSQFANPEAAAGAVYAFFKQKPQEHLWISRLAKTGQMRIPVNKDWLREIHVQQASAGKFDEAFQLTQSQNRGMQQI